MKHSNYSITFQDAIPSINNALACIADPVVQTLSPYGGNALIQTKDGGIFVTNDGVTIAKNITPEGEFEKSIVNIIRETAFKTNSEAGDGTTTSILLASTLLKDGIKLREQGHNGREIVDWLKENIKSIYANLELQRVSSPSDDLLKSIANVSANNDPIIAENAFTIAKAAGADGMVFIEESYKDKDIIKIESGFTISSGILDPVFRTSGFTSEIKDAVVFVTNRRLYYDVEADAILRTAFTLGKNKVIVMATDFIGRSIDIFKANASSKKFEIALIKAPSDDTLFDFATYTGAKVVQEADGKLVDIISANQYGKSTRIFADSFKSVIEVENKTNDDINSLIGTLKVQLEDKKDDESLTARLAALTSGIATIYVRGDTPSEMQERVFRYEDAINAVRNAMKHGILPGGGVALFQAYKEAIIPKSPYAHLISNLCRASYRQVGVNSGMTVDEIDEILETSDLDDGYNAITKCVDNMFDSGIIDPYMVTKLSVQNAISVASNILGVNYFIINNTETK